MLVIPLANKIMLAILIFILFIISLGIILSIIFNNKQSKKYNECLRLIKEKENGTLKSKNDLNIDSKVDVNKLTQKLYDIYLEFVNKLNNNDEAVLSLLNGFIKEIYKNKLDIYKTKNINEISDSIELLNYSILEYEKNKIQFRINISCFNYKKTNDVITSGNNLERVEQIFLITYVKSRNKWLINNIEKVYEKKLSI